MDSYFCEQHQTKWFKTGKMKTYAHPVKGANGETTGWCNMPDDAVPTVVKEAVKQGAVIVEEKMTKEDWDAKDQRTRKSIEKQKALEIANEYVKNKIIAGKELTYDDVLKVADHFYDWINN